MLDLALNIRCTPVIIYCHVGTLIGVKLYSRRKDESRIRRMNTVTRITIKNGCTIALTRIITIGIVMRIVTTINISPRTTESIATTQS